MAAVPRAFWQIPLFLVAWLGALELLVRLFLVTPSNIIADPQLGYMYQPNSTMRIESADAGFRRVGVNEFGLNDWPLRDGDTRRRIVVLGDSYVEAFQLPRAQNFVAILGRDDPQLRFVNAGRSGLDPITESMMLEKLTPRIQPAGVIMVVNAGDRFDFLGDHLTTARCAPAICAYRLPPIRPVATSGLAGLARQSALVTFLARRFMDPVASEIAEAKRMFPQFAAAKASPTPPDGYRDRDFEGVLGCVFRRIESRYPLLVVAIPQIDFEASGRSAPSDGGAFEADVARAAAASGARFFDAGPALEDVYARTGQPPRGFPYNTPGAGHLNAAGHETLARGIEPFVAMFEGGTRR
jgi:hypothetical protein